MIKDKSITIMRGGVRLDAALLALCPSSSRAFVREAIQSGDILVNGRRAAKGLKLHGGEQIEINELFEQKDNLVLPTPQGDSPHENAGDSPHHENGVCPRLVFKDESLLAFDKRAGQPVQPLSCRETGTLMNDVVALYPECRTLGDSPLMAGALHRIDADTSGLVLVARTAEAFANLRAQFSTQTVEKTYLALVEGAVAVGGTLENDLIHDPTLPFCRMIDREHCRLTKGQIAHLKPLHAVTRYRPIAHTTVENEERTLLEVTIFTGVTHQIRAQLALAGLHIVNDRLYGAFAVENQVGHCLHALAAKFRHPVTGEEITLRTELPVWAQECRA